MKNNGDYEALLRLGNIPEKMIMTHGCENLAEFVLHTLCRDPSLMLSRAAFFLDNPDFNCLKGVVGVCHKDCFPSEDTWNHVTDFSNHMRQSAFNNAVRSIARESIIRTGAQWAERAADLAKTIAIDDHEFYTFSAKHGNTGLLLFAPSELSGHARSMLTAGSSLLGLCPVF